MAIDDKIAYMGGAAALPRSNGELVFDEPWQTRAFGMAVGLSQAGHYPWVDFRDLLIGAIERWEHEKADGDAWRYWERWMEALEALLDEMGIAGHEEIEARMAQIAAIPEH